MNDTPALNFIMNVRQNNIDAVRELLKYNPKLINVIDEYDSSALLYALQNGNMEMVNLLLAKGADVHAVDKLNNDSFHYANKLENKELSELLKKKSDEQLKNKLKKTNQKKYNPFSAFDFEDCVFYEIEPSTFGTKYDLNNANLFDSDVRTFLCIHTKAMSYISDYNKGKNLSFSSANPTEELIAQTVIIDFISDAPVLPEGKDKFAAEKQIRGEMFENSSVYDKLNMFEHLGVTYYIDYNIHTLINKLKRM
jgi:hypothetical protein